MVRFSLIVTSLITAMFLNPVDVPQGKTNGKQCMPKCQSALLQYCDECKCYRVHYRGDDGKFHDVTLDEFCKSCCPDKCCPKKECCPEKCCPCSGGKLELEELKVGKVTISKSGIVIKGDDGVDITIRTVGKVAGVWVGKGTYFSSLQYDGFSKSVYFATHNNDQKAHGIALGQSLETGESFLQFIDKKGNVRRSPIFKK